MLRLHFRETSHEHGSKVPALVLGQVVHAALERAVAAATAGEVFGGSIDVHWAAAVEAVASKTGLAGDEIVRMAGYQLKRARVRRVVQTLEQLLDELQPVTRVLTETDVHGEHGRLRGRIDLVIDAPDGAVLVDYKTGTVLDGEGFPMTSYRQQLQLYAFMYASTYNWQWPVRAYLVPLTGEPIAVPIESSECELLAQNALNLLDEYKSRLPDPPAAASPTTCRLCPYAPRCPAFWGAIDGSWEDALVAVNGMVIETHHAGDGLVSARLAPSAGSVEDDGTGILVRAIHCDSHPAARSIREGMLLAAVGLYKEPGRESYALTGTGRISVAAPEG